MKLENSINRLGSQGRIPLEIHSSLKSAVQGELFPLATILEAPNEQTADAWGEVIAEDGHRYTVKADKGGQFVRAAEWIFTHIAERLNISCATPKIIKLNDGRMLFGSRHLSGTADAVTTAEILTSLTLGSSGTQIPGLQSLLSGVYALDMFANNVDRHEGNYLSVDTYGTRRFSVIDFGRSLIIGGDPEAFPDSFHNTVSTGRKIRQRHGFDLSAGNAILDRLLDLAPAFIKEKMDAMPDGWLTESDKNQFLDWWSSSRRPAKIERLRKGLIDGTRL